MTTIAASGESRFSRAIAARWEVVAFLSPVVIFSLLVVRHAFSFADDHNPIILANGASLLLIGVAFALRRPAKDVDRSWTAWGAAIIGDFAPFGMMLQDPVHWAGYVPLVIQCCALTLSCWAVWNIWESIGIVPANRGIKVGGPYRFIRHPMYAGVMLSQVALLLVFPSPINISMFVILTTFKAIMIRNEERLLMKDPTYVSYAQKTRWRVIPFVI